MPRLFITIAIIILLILSVSAWYFARESGNIEPRQFSLNRVYSRAIDEPPVSGGDIAAGASDEAGESRPGATSLHDLPREQKADGSAGFAASNDSIRSALRYEQPILSALEWAASLQDPTGNNTFERNAAVWMIICKDDELVSRSSASGARSRHAIQSNLVTFCEGFSEDTVETIDQFIQSKAQRFSQGNNRHAELMNLSQSRGADTAVEQAIASIAVALVRLDYAQVLELVWLAGLLPSISPEPMDPNVERAMSGDAQVAFAVSAALYCRRLGDCQSMHPVVLLLCQQMWPDRQCSNPRDIHDAIRQLLTGSEYEEYLAMVNFINARIGSRD